MDNNILYNLKENGYVALMSTIIIGAVLLVMTIEVGQSGWYTRFMVLGRESKSLSRNLAISCTNRTLLLVMKNINDGISGTTTNEIGSCYVYPVQENYPSSGHLTLRIQSDVRGSLTNLVTEYDMHNFHFEGTPLPVTALPLTSIPELNPIVIRQIEVSTLP